MLSLGLVDASSKTLLKVNHQPSMPADFECSNTCEPTCTIKLMSGPMCQRICLLHKASIPELVCSTELGADAIAKVIQSLACGMALRATVWDSCLACVPNTLECS